MLPLLLEMSWYNTNSNPTPSCQVRNFYDDTKPQHSRRELRPTLFYMSAVSKPRQPRLRASCDGCFLAKVKCSKSRPVCSRCLSCGIICHYSPSSRAGKPKPGSSQSPRLNTSHDVQAPPSFGDENAVSYPNQAPHDHGFSQERGWPTSSIGIENSISRNHSFTSGTPLLGYDYDPGILNTHESILQSSGLYADPLDWEVPREGGCGPIPDMSTMAQMPGSRAARPYSFDIPGSSISTPWGGRSHEMPRYSQVQTPSSYLPNPSEMPGLSHQIVSSKQDDTFSAHVSACCQAVVALHDASVLIPPPMDVVLAAARQAIDMCSQVEEDATLFLPGGTFTFTMLLATIIGKITSILKSMDQTYFELSSIIQMPENPSSTSGGGVNMGGYQVTPGSASLRHTLSQIEFTHHELRRLESIFRRFSNICPELSQDRNFSGALGGYIRNNVNFAIPNLESTGLNFEPSTLNMASEGEQESSFETP